MEREFKDKLVHFLQEALAEDVGAGDFTSLSTIKAGAMGEAHLLVKEAGVLAGVEVAEQLFVHIDPTTEFDAIIHDGQHVQSGEIAFRIRGSIHSILKAERLVLNVMQRMSGIATLTAHYVNAVEGTGTKVLD